jgi:signal transduction histidine kinase
MADSFCAENAIEEQRITALKKYEILDTPPEESFDHVAQLAARLLKVPVALITLVDADRTWVKSAVGANIQEISKESSLCATAIQSNDIYIVEDARKHSQLFDNSFVTKFDLQFYAAVPLKMRDGFKLGTLCVMDKKARTLSAEEKFILEKLAGIVVDQLEHRLEARMTNAEQVQILNMVAHELKNPLSIIPAYVDIIKNEPAVTPHIVQMLNHIQKAGERMKALISQVLETGHLKTAEIKLNKGVFNLAALAGRATTINLVLANAKQQKLLLDISDNVLVRGDEEKIIEIMDNLINNAIKYSPHDSKISVKVRVEHHSAVFEVIDEGPGLTASDIKRLFMPFTRLTAQPTGGEHSTGIGLFIVKRLVNAHGGSIRAWNNAGKGACFSVKFPSVADKN